MADGSITFSTKLDNKDLEKDLAKVKKEIQKTEETISSQEAKKSPLVKQAAELEQKMKAARAEVKRCGEDWAAGVAGADKNQSAAQERLKGIQGQYQKVTEQIDKVDAKLQPAYEKLDAMKDKAGGLQQQINKASSATNRMKDATAAAEKQMAKFTKRIKGLAKRVFVFTLITAALRSLKDWLWQAIKTNDEAVTAVSRLKGALLTLAQPLVEVVIPAFTVFVNILAALLSKIAQVVAKMSGMTAEEASKAAEALYEEMEALKGTGKEAKKASKSLASFDEINKLGGDSSTNESSSITPDFGAGADTSWLDSALEGVAGKVAAALMLGGVALVAIGAGTGSLLLVLAGLALLGAGVVVGEDAGGFESWAKTLGLDSVTQYVSLALLLGGIALVAIGAATGSIMTVIAGLGLLGSGIALAEESETVQSWVETLGLESVNQFVSTALLLGGIAVIAIGAMMGNIMMILAGLGLIGGGIAYADEETKASWKDTLGLDSVFDYVTAAIQLAGIALIAIGACMGNIAMVIAGGVILALGVAADAIGEETLKKWWEVLQLTTVQQWVGAALLLVGIALVAIGACMGNILMVLAGAACLAVGTITSASEGNLKDWVTTLGLQKVAGWVTAGLLLVGLALVVFGIFTGNIMMILAGAGMLGAGIAIGVTSGTFASWLDTIITAFSGFKTKVLSIFSSLWGGVKSWINTLLGGVESMANKVINGINWVIDAMNRIHFDMPDWLGGGSFGFNIRKLNTISIPRLATGAVVPPNREFMAVLGDNKTETEVVSPLSTMKQAMIEALRESGGGKGNTTIVFKGELAALARVLRPYIEEEGLRVGDALVTK